MARLPHTPAAAGFPPDLVAHLLQAALRRRRRLPVLGIAGPQGCGKSTLAAQLVAAAGAQGIDAVAISLDDVYLLRRERQQLARDVHPLLATRGPPGSHDIRLGCDTIDALRQLLPGQPVPLPRFDKLADTRLPPSRWPRCRRRPGLIVLEGWCLKVPPQAESELAVPVNRLEREEDPDGRWRRWCNTALAGYAPLWSRIGTTVYLAPPGFEVVPGWRAEQEAAMVAARPARGGMDAAALVRFVEHFERVSRHAMHTLPGIAEHVLQLDANRRVR